MSTSRNVLQCISGLFTLGFLQTKAEWVFGQSSSRVSPSKGISSCTTQEHSAGHRAYGHVCHHTPLLPPSQALLLLLRAPVKPSTSARGSAAGSMCLQYRADTSTETGQLKVMQLQKHRAAAQMVQPHAAAPVPSPAHRAGSSQLPRTPRHESTRHTRDCGSDTALGYPDHGGEDLTLATEPGTERKTNSR